MKRIDAYYLYQLGHQIHAIAGIRTKLFDTGDGYTKKRDATHVLRAALDALNEFMLNSIYKVKVTVSAADVLRRELSIAVQAYEIAEEDEGVDFFEFGSISNALRDFEAVLKAEFNTIAVYLVDPKNAMDTVALIESGDHAFPTELATKVPAAIADVQQAMKCIAFELPTAAAFHLHRANEAVLKSYWAALANGKTLPEKTTMGGIVQLMEQDKIGRDEIRSSLRDIVRLHRNPTIHPETSLADVEEALNLYGAIRSIIGFMLKEIPVLESKP